MLNYRINAKDINKTKVNVPVTKVTFVDLNELTDEEGEPISYGGENTDKVMMYCECEDIDNIKNNTFINAINTLALEGEVYYFSDNFKIQGVNEENRSFSIYIDKYKNLNVENILLEQENTDYSYVKLICTDYHYFDRNDNLVEYEVTNEDEEETKIEMVQEIPIYFRYTDRNGDTFVKKIKFQYYLYNVLITTTESFKENTDLYEIIFGGGNFDSTDEEGTMSVNGDLSGIEIYRENFLFGEKCFYYFQYERALVNIPLPLSNTFETNLHQTHLLQEQFVDEEKKKAINDFIDMEKDVYYPVIVDNNNTYKDVYSIKFNLHFREHRGKNWLVDGNSLWNGVKSVYDKQLQKYTKAEIYKIDNNKITDDNVSDLLSYLDFTDNDIYFQKNKLKKSFLRLSFYDSTNPANQNLLGYSTIFLNGGEIFGKYVRYMETDKNYVVIKADNNDFGIYTVPTKKNQKIKQSISVNRESVEINNDNVTKINFEEKLRLSSQLIVKSKNISTSSSEGFYLYLWRDNESAIPQDLYMKVEFNHAGYGRTMPFMMPYWDKEKWKDNDLHKNGGIKTFEEILADWKDEKIYDPYGNISWKNKTDGHYGMRQYAKFSYIHFKYRYDKNTDKHVYYLDPDIYGDCVKANTAPTDEDGNNYIEINLYEAKVE